MLGISVVFLLTTISASALTNGLARTPPMGWSSWYYFFGHYNETVIRETCDAMVTNGLKAAGYRLVILDDCVTSGRDQNGNLVTDPVRFPSGMNALGDWIHSKGLKFGVYVTAANYPGFCGGPTSYGQEARDVATCASWGIDCLRVDGLGGLGANVTEPVEAAVRRWHSAVMAEGRPFLLSFLGGWFERWKPELGNFARISLDINLSWHGVTNNLNELNGNVRFGGPGGWMDPDMIFIGSPSDMNDTENRAFFSLWCITASPLILGSDVRYMTPETKAIVTAPELIAIDQDPLGVQGSRIASTPGPGGGGNLEIWCKPLSDPNCKAVALFNQSARAETMTVSWTNLLLQPGDAMVRDVWTRADLGTFSNSFTTNVPSHGAVVLKITGRPMPPPVFLSNVTNFFSTGLVSYDGSFGNYFGFPVLYIGNVFYRKGIVMSAPASITYNLNTLPGFVTRFVADIGLDIDSLGFGEAIYQVWADGVLLHQSGPITTTSAVETISVDLTRHKMLTLATFGTGNADWGDARVLAWPALSLVAQLGTNGCRLRLTGGQDGSYAIETSSNLVTWSTITNLTSAGGEVEFLDPPAAGFNHCFYRARKIEQ